MRDGPAPPRYQLDGIRQPPMKGDVKVHHDSTIAPCEAQSVRTFDHADFGSIRVVVKDNAPWFVAKDVCDALGLENNRKAVSSLEEDEKNTVTISDGIPGNPNKTIVSEPGFYRLVMKSRKPEAKAFQRWVTHEVLPSIRKFGVYATAETAERLMSDPDFMIKTFEALKKERERVRALEAVNRRNEDLLARKERRLDEMRPKAVFADAVSASHSSILIGDLAKILKQNGVDMGQKRLFAWMRENGWLMKNSQSRNMPTQRGMDMGLFRVKETTISNPDGSVRVTRTTKVTGKGQQYFVNLFLNGAVA